MALGLAFFWGTLALLMKITLQLRFAFVRHCDVFLLRYNEVISLFNVVAFFMTLELRYILERSNYV